MFLSRQNDADGCPAVGYLAKAVRVPRSWLSTREQVESSLSPLKRTRYRLLVQFTLTLLFTCALQNWNIARRAQTFANLAAIHGSLCRHSRVAISPIGARRLFIMETPAAALLWLRKRGGL